MDKLTAFDKLALKIRDLEPDNESIVAYNDGHYIDITTTGISDETIDTLEKEFPVQVLRTDNYVWTVFCLLDEINQTYLIDEME